METDEDGEEVRRMKEILTMAQIEERFPSEWVLIEDPEVDEHMEIIRGKVLWHGKDRDELDRIALELRPKSPAFLHTGPFPEDMEFVL
jgi:hypothetical protein